MSDVSLDDVEHCSLCEALDRVLTKGVVVSGEVMISVADIDLIYLGLQLVLTSAENIRQAADSPAEIYLRPMSNMRMGLCNE